MKRLLLSLAFPLVLVARAVSAEPARPNVLVLFCDDQRADTIAALGNAHIRTPNLDRLARRGVAFNRAYMMGAMQGATCVPSRAMLLSGSSLFRVDTKLLRDETWPAAFGRAGYRTFISGKWHNAPEAIAKAFQRAKSVLVAGMTDPMHAELSDIVDGRITPPKLCPQHACAEFADQTIALIRERSDRPFFAYVPFDGPHDPHIVPDDFPIRYRPEDIPLPANFLPQHPWDNGWMKNRDESLLPWPRTPEAVRGMLAEYYRYISYLDMLIGRILDELDASPYAKNTYVVFSADSGVSRGSHGLIGKQNVYEDAVRVPLIIAGPGLPAGQRTDAMCYLFDLLPTLGRLCRVDAPPASEGMDLSAVLRNPTAAGRPAMFFVYRDVQKALRDERWKLIRYPQVDRTQLFDLSKDPQEITNLADRPENAERVRTMMARLAAEMKQWDDPFAALVVAHPKPAAWSPQDKWDPQPLKYPRGVKQGE